VSKIICIKNAEKNTEKNIVVVELPGSPISSSTPHDLCNKYVINLRIKNNYCVVSPRFQIHTTGIGSQLLNKMGYTKGGPWKNGHGIVVPITPEMKSPRTGLG
jgi:hypothetical protein